MNISNYKECLVAVTEAELQSGKILHPEYTEYLAGVIWSYQLKPITRDLPKAFLEESFKEAGDSALLLAANLFNPTKSREYYTTIAANCYYELSEAKYDLFYCIALCVPDILPVLDCLSYERKRVA